MKDDNVTLSNYYFHTLLIMSDPWSIIKILYKSRTIPNFNCSIVRASCKEIMIRWYTNLVNCTFMFSHMCYKGTWNWDNEFINISFWKTLQDDQLSNMNVPSGFQFWIVLTLGVLEDRVVRGIKAFVTFGPNSMK